MRPPHTVNVSADARLLCTARSGSSGGGGEPDIERIVEGGEREDVPGVGGDDEGGNKIDLVGRVRAAVAADRANISPAKKARTFARRAQVLRRATNALLRMTTQGLTTRRPCSAARAMSRVLPTRHAPWRGVSTRMT